MFFINNWFINIIMRKLWFIIFILIIIPVFAYDVYTPDNYKYEQAGDKLLFVVDVD